MAAAGVFALLGCTLGAEQAPGCRGDSECDEGSSCRAGACFRETAERAPPATDAGDGGAEDAG